MNAKERFYASVQYEKPDRPPIAPLHAQFDVWKKLYEYFDVTTYEAFQLKVGEDFRYIEPQYIGPELRTFGDGSWESIWGERYQWVSFGNSANAESVYQPYVGITSIKEAKKLRYPSPDWYDYSMIKTQCDKYDGYALYAGSMGHGDFLNGVAFCRGVQQVLLDVATEDPVYLYFVERRYEFFYEQIKRILEAAEGKIDVVRFGDDLGTQNGPIINPKTFEKLFSPKYKSFFNLVHQYGAKTMMHSCGSIKAFIPLLIDIGLDIIDVVQVDAAHMAIEELHHDFYGKIVFSGSLSVQNLLRSGTVDDIIEEVERRRELFADGGIFIGPTNVMQVDMPIENFMTMCTTIGCMKDNSGLPYSVHRSNDMSKKWGQSMNSQKKLFTADHKKVHVILDTDIGPDCDDAGALAVLHALADNGEAEILGVMHCTSNPWGVPCIDAINTYYDRPSIPVGTLKVEGFLNEEVHKKYNLYVAQHFPNKYQEQDIETLDAVELYREILSSQPNDSVVMVAIGPLPNLRNLLLSHPDEKCPLSGWDLVAQKVNRLVVMGGYFPRGEDLEVLLGAEWNFEMDPLAAQYVAANWPTPIMFTDFLIGFRIFTGKRLLTETPAENPVRKAYELYTEDGSRMSWDLTAALYAVRGLNDYWEAELGGCVEVLENGKSIWKETPDKQHGYLKVKMDSTKVAEVLEDLMVKSPRRP